MYVFSFKLRKNIALCFFRLHFLILNIIKGLRLSLVLFIDEDGWMQNQAIMLIFGAINLTFTSLNLVTFTLRISVSNLCTILAYSLHNNTKIQCFAVDPI